MDDQCEVGANLTAGGTACRLRRWELQGSGACGRRWRCGWVGVLFRAGLTAVARLEHQGHDLPFHAERHAGRTGQRRSGESAGEQGSRGIGPGPLAVVGRCRAGDRVEFDVELASFAREVVQSELPRRHARGLA